MLNTHAFGARRGAVSEIKRTMVVRNQNFVNRSLRVSKAHLGLMESETGSVYSQRFSGWEEQQTGRGGNRSRVATMAARGGTESKQIAPSARMKPGTNFLRPRNVKGGNYTHRLSVLLEILRRDKITKTFLVHRRGKGKLRKLSPGLYKRRGKVELVKLQSLDAPKKTARNPWMTNATRRYFQRVDTRQLWAQQLRRLAL